MSPGTAIIGAHQTRAVAAEQERSLEEMIFEASRSALEDADLTIDEIDAVVLSTSDQQHGRVIESMVTNGAAGGVGRDVTTVASGGEHSLVYAHLRLLARQGRRVLVVTWGKASESVDLQHAQRISAEPFLLRPYGMDQRIAACLQASAYVMRYGLDDRAVDHVRRRRIEAARRRGWTTTSETGGMVGWPLCENDLPHSVDIAGAAVVATEDAVTSEHEAAWIRGIGWATDRYELGDRDLSRFEAMQRAAAHALGGVSLQRIDAAEVQEISIVGGFAALEALGLSDVGQGASMASEPWVNPSGGSLWADAGNASGFLRLLDAAQQARGRAGSVQVERTGGAVLGATLHGFAGQGSTVVAFASSMSEPL